MCGLLYEVTWIRLLTLIFGASVFATSAVLTTFMGGLAFGSYLFGRIVDRSRNPLKIYAILELGIGVYALALPFVLNRFDVLYAFLFRGENPSFYMLSLSRFVLAVAVLLLPTTLMGATLPVLSKFVTSRLKDISWSTGSLYAINTLGAVAGCAAAGFFLIGRFGVLRTIHIAVIANLAVGILTYLISAMRTLPMKATATDSISAAPSESRAEYPRRIVMMVMLLFGISGFCSLAYEVLWMRALLFHMNISIYAFTTMLTTFLLGIGLGSLVFGKISDRNKDALSLFCALEVLIGVTAILSLPIFGKFFYSLERLFPSFGVISWLPSANKFVKASLTMLIPAFLMGATFPVVVRICAQSLQRIGKSVGTIYSVNTIGCILGSFASGFVLIPLLGIGKSILLLGCINVVVGATAYFMHPHIHGRRKALIFVGTAPAVLFFGIAVFRLSGIQFTSPLEDIGKVVYYKEGIGATVKVFDNKSTGIREISIDGYPVACSGNIMNMRGPEIQRALAHYPMLLHREPKDVCIVGFGAGGTSYNVSLYDVDSITCVELCVEVPKAAPLLRSVNHDVLNDPRFSLIIEDGRNYLLRTDRDFDVITVDATSPKFAGNVSLYTKEFYDMCSDRLRPGGVMALWVPYHLLSYKEDLLLFNTFRHSFPYFSVWFTSDRGYFLLIGSEKPITIDFKHLEERMSEPKVQKALAGVGLGNPYNLLACHLMNESAPASLFRDVPINTDNHPYIEYFRNDGAGLGEFIFESRMNEPYVYHFGDTEEEAIRNARKYRRFMTASDHLISAHYWRNKGILEEAINQTRLAQKADSGNLEAFLLRKSLEDRFREIHLAEAARAHAKNDMRRALLACNTILRVIPNDPHTLDMLGMLRENVSGWDDGLRPSRGIEFKGSTNTF